MEIIGIKTQLFKEGDSLADFIKAHVSSLKEGSVIVVTSKIVALSEGRTGAVSDKKKLILAESKKAIETPWALLTLGADGWGINAGADESNAEGKVILLPKDSFKTAELLQKKLKRRYSLKKLGVVISDTRSVPLRVGTVGRAIGFAGLEPLKSYVGKKDLFGRKSRVTKSNHSDALAAAAVLVMGEGDERIPLAVITGAPVAFTQKPLSRKSRQLAFPPEKDIFAYVFDAMRRKSRLSSKE